MLDSIQESFEKQSREQGRPIYSSENRYYLSHLEWKDTLEGVLFWRILYVSYAMYGVYDYETLIRIFSRFQCIPNLYEDIYDIYYDYFDQEKGTLSEKGYEILLK